MADITPVQITDTAADRAYIAAANGGDKIVNAATDIILQITNTNVTTRTVTIAAVNNSVQASGYGTVTLPDKVISVAQNEEQIVRIPRLGFKNPADAFKVAVTYDSEVDVSLRAFYL